MSNHRPFEAANWRPASEAPEGVLVLTKIDNDLGVRNEIKLRRIGGLWWVADGSMYVYYTPTHYRSLPPASSEQRGP